MVGKHYIVLTTLIIHESSINHHLSHQKNGGFIIVLQTLHIYIAYVFALTTLKISPFFSPESSSTSAKTTVLPLECWECCPSDGAGDVGAGVSAMRPTSMRHRGHGKDEGFCWEKKRCVENGVLSMAFWWSSMSFWVFFWVTFGWSSSCRAP